MANPFFGTPAKITEEQKIDKLISYIENLKDVTFIRNGSEHSPKEAAEHLRMKRSKAGKAIKTAKDFIEKVASKSSLSGSPYELKLKSGKKIQVEIVLKAELEKLEKN